MDIFKERILPLLANSGKTSTQLESEMGLPKKIISDWKNEKNKSYIRHIDKIAVYFNVTTDYLLGNDNQLVKEPEAPAQNGLDPEVARALQLFLKLPLQEQDAMLAQIFNERGKKSAE